MCDVLDRVESRGFVKGREEGILKGQELKGIRVYQNMIKRGFSPAEAQAIAELTDEEVTLAEAKSQNKC